MSRVSRIMFEQGVDFSEAMYLANEFPPRNYKEESEEEEEEEEEEENFDNYTPLTEKEVQGGLGWLVEMK